MPPPTLNIGKTTVLAWTAAILNANPSFEAGIANWNAFGGTQAASTAQAYSGTGSLLLTPDGVSATARTECEQVAGALTGQSWTGESYVFCPVAAVINANINWFDSVGNFLSTTNGANISVAAGVWTYVSVVGNAPANARRASLSMNENGTPPTTKPFYIDSALVHPTAIVPYISGSISLGPSDQQNRGPASWSIDTVIMKTSRPGSAPIPRVELYLNGLDVNGRQFISYDGSFSNAGGNCVVGRGETLTAVWTGGIAGDVAELTLSGTKS